MIESLSAGLQRSHEEAGVRSILQMKKWTQRGGYPRSSAVEGGIQTQACASSVLPGACGQWGCCVPLPKLHPRSPQGRVIYYYSGILIHKASRAEEDCH